MAWKALPQCPAQLAAAFHTASQDLRRAIADAGLHPSQVVLELTEHDPIPNGSALLRVLDPFFDEGMSLSIDDVGAGFANMRLICELQPHFLKSISSFSQASGIVP